VGSVINSSKCWFRLCRFEAKQWIKFKGKSVAVCEIHATTWKTSWERENPS
jgi:hypothetical protein